MKVNKVKINLFSSFDWKNAKKEYERKLGIFKEKSKNHKVGDIARSSEIIAYFNDEEDVYKVAILGIFLDLIVKDVYSWDELSELIHDNM